MGEMKEHRRRARRPAMAMAMAPAMAPASVVACAAMLVATPLGCSLLVSTDGLAAADAGDEPDEASLPGVDAAGPGAADGSEGGSPIDADEGLARAAAYDRAVRADGPALFVRFDGRGPIAADALGGSLSGVATSGASFGAESPFGPAGSGVAFDGATGEVWFGDVFDFAGTASYTLEAWIKPAIVDGRRRRIVDKSASNTAGYRFYVYLDTDGAELRCGRCVAGNCSDAANALPAGKYLHVACTYDGANVNVYVDGVAATPLAHGAIEESAEPFRLGRRAEDEAFSGVMDDVAVYDKALSAARIVAHFRAGAGL